MTMMMTTMKMTRLLHLLSLNYVEMILHNNPKKRRREQIEGQRVSTILLRWTSLEYLQQNSQLNLSPISLGATSSQASTSFAYSKKYAKTKLTETSCW
jgi:hypothetical protein